MTLTNRRSLIKEFFKRADILLLIVCVISSVFGIIAISSATANIGSGKYIIVQTFSLFLGLVAFFIFTIIDPDVIAKQWLPLSVLSAILILGLMPFGHDDGTGIFKHRDEIGEDERTGEEVFGGAKQKGSLPSPNTVAIEAAVAGVDHEVFALEALRHLIGARQIGNPRVAGVGVIAPES